MKKTKKQMKDLMGTGIAGMAGLYAVGSMGSLPGMPANNVTGITSAGVNIAAIGNLANIGMNIIPKGKSTGKKDISNRVLDKGLYRGKYKKHKY